MNASGAPVHLYGVDATGTEDACIQGRGFSWGPFNSAEAQSIASWGANAVRVPLNEDCWLGINGAPPAYSGTAYQAAVETWVSELNATGMVAILDLHWTAPGTLVATSQWPMPDQTHSPVFWSQVASAFASDPLVMFDLFNEPALGHQNPSAANWTCWLNGCDTTASPNCPQTTSASYCVRVGYRVAGMQELVDTVRAAGANQPIMVGGLTWAGKLAGWLAHEPVDPLQQLVASFHTYSNKACNTATCWSTVLAPLAQKVPVVTGELGEADCSAAYVQTFMQWADTHGISYLLWAWQPATTSSCGQKRLLSNWKGTPNTKNPVAPTFLAHLGVLHPPKI